MSWASTGLVLGCGMDGTCEVQVLHVNITVYNIKNIHFQTKMEGSNFWKDEREGPKGTLEKQKWKLNAFCKVWIWTWEKLNQTKTKHWRNQSNLHLCLFSPWLHRCPSRAGFRSSTHPDWQYEQARGLKARMGCLVCEWCSDGWGSTWDDRKSNCNRGVQRRPRQTPGLKGSLTSFQP